MTQPPGYACPPAWPDRSTARPGSVTAAAVLAFVQAGVTALGTMLGVWALAVDLSSGGPVPLQWAVSAAQAIGAGLLSAGGVALTRGSGRGLLVAGCVSQLMLTVYYVLFSVVASDSTIDPQNTLARDNMVEAGRAIMMVTALVFAIMPIISLVLALGRRATDFFLRGQREGQPTGFAIPAMPAPMMPPPRPGVVTAAAVLAYVQAGITGTLTPVLFASLFVRQAGTGAVQMDMLAVLATWVGAALLIAGGVWLTRGGSRVLLVVACALELAICAYYLIAFMRLSARATDVINELGEVDGGLLVARDTMLFMAIFFAIMPTISLVLALGRRATDFLHGQRTVPSGERP